MCVFVVVCLFWVCFLTLVTCFKFVLCFSVYIIACMVSGSKRCSVVRAFTRGTICRSAPSAVPVNVHNGVASFIATTTPCQPPQRTSWLDDISSYGFHPRSHTLFSPNLSDCKHLNSSCILFWMSICINSPFSSIICFSFTSPHLRQHIDPRDSWTIWYICTLNVS